MSSTMTSSARRSLVPNVLTRMLELFVEVQNYGPSGLRTLSIGQTTPLVALIAVFTYPVVFGVPSSLLYRGKHSKMARILHSTDSSPLVKIVERKKNCVSPM